MTTRKSIFSRIRLVYRPSAPVLKWVVLVMVIFCTVTLVVLGAAIHKGMEQQERQRQQAIVLEQENQRLTKYIAELGTVQGVIRIAREELDLEDPDAIIFDPVETTNP